jgi:hypothetical protein
MTDDLDIYRAANSLIDHRGEEAEIHAAMRADELMEVGDYEGCVVWRRILTAIDVLWSEEGPLH